MAGDSNQARMPAKPPIWADPRYRALLYQVIVLGGVIAVGAWLVHNTMASLERQGIASGFDFLNRTAGFSISTSLIPYQEEDSYGRAFLVGLLNTILVSGIGIVFATIIGFTMGVLRLSRNWLIAKIAAAYIEILRNIPLLLQLFFWYFGVLRTLPAPRQSVSLFDTFFLNIRGLYSPQPLPQPGFWWIPGALGVGIVASIVLAKWAKKRMMDTGRPFPVLWTSLAIIVGLPVLATLVTGFPLKWDYPELKGFNFAGGLQMVPEFVALLLALSLYTAAFIAEIVRAGILSISHGQTEAAHALGLRPTLTLRLVVIPQAARLIIPPLTSQYLNLMKNSSLAAAIAYPDLVLVFAGTVLMQTGQAVEIIAMTMAVYLSLSLLISMFMNWYNKKMALVER